MLAASLCQRNEKYCVKKMVLNPEVLKYMGPDIQNTEFENRRFGPSGAILQLQQVSGFNGICKVFQEFFCKFKHVKLQVGAKISMRTFETNGYLSI